MLILKINYSDGDSTLTRFNGTLAEAEKYYVGQVFNTGSVRDNMVKCESIEIIAE